MQEVAKILSRRGNVAVLLLPDRKFPALAMQGDSLSILRQDIENIVTEAKKSNVSTVLEIATELIERIRLMIAFYEETCEENDFRKSY